MSITQRAAPAAFALAAGLGLTAAAPASAKAPQTADRCTALVGQVLTGAGRITAAQPGAAQLPAGPFGGAPTVLPAHCEVFGVLQDRAGRLGQRYAINYHLRLPQDWNGRLLFQGGGGTNGDIGSAVGPVGPGAKSALARGFAVISQDSGHDNKRNTDPRWGGQTVFGTDPAARANYGHASLPQAAAAARAITARFYGKAPERSYFYGCSKGGQEGMAAAQRYPALFDGIVAAAPGFALPRAALNEAWNVQQVAALARQQTGAPATVSSIAATFSPAQLGLVRKAVLEACDAADGLADGITADFRKCTSARVLPRLRAAQCRAGEADTCLSPSQIGTFAAMMTGPRSAAGRPLYARWAWDGGTGSPMWAMWRIGSEQRPAFDISLGGASLPTVFSVPPRPVGPTPNDTLAYQLSLRFPAAASAIYARRAPFQRSAWEDIGMHSANLDGFIARGGKLLVPHGVSDPVFSVEDTLGWWDRVAARYGARTDGAVRVFPVPGMAHCGGGPATDDYDMLTALTDWVERGQAPAQVIARAGGQSPWPGRTRPLCAWPTVARYKGGDPEKAESFSCSR